MSPIHLWEIQKTIEKIQQLLSERETTQLVILHSLSSQGRGRVRIFHGPDVGCEAKRAS